MQSEVSFGRSADITSEGTTTETGSTEVAQEGTSGGCEAQAREEESGGRSVGARGRGAMQGVERLREVRARLEALRKWSDEWTCFLCCHVRTGTIVIGIWHMLLHLITLSLIVVMVVNPDTLKQSGNDPRGAGSGVEQLTVEPLDVQAVNCGAEMPCILAAQGDGNTEQVTSDFSLSISNFMTTHRPNTDEMNVALFITLCMFIVTLLLVHGAFRRQPSHLMPFFFLQVFDFCISSMTMIGYVSYLPNIRQLIQDNPAFPFQQQLLAMNTKCLTFFAMLIFITTLMVKAYCISIVWRCYKYLMLKVQAGRSVLRYLGGVSGPVDQESQTLVMGQDLPDYDTAIADPQYRKKLSGMFPEPPPSYDMAMAALSAQHGSEGGTVSSLPQEPSAATQDQTNAIAGEGLPGASDAAPAATTTTTVLVNTASHSAC
ncbi:lysosomal-associated transmembrane protein 4B-like isoform X2 [Eriocheir sinensis]|uniref:lysosomal-associated transmembrane protein 4B-like isoform X2 n=1 Tax=Eriocheir sinensis TaxID=95602 RepID=UPI0021C7AC77|nr:lysosomal-associated transmembrane protein 4B-like isoform X2 [Eriocheir sinensis]